MTCRRAGEVQCAAVQDFSAYLWSNTDEMQILQYLKRSLHFQIIRLDLASQLTHGNPRRKAQDINIIKNLFGYLSTLRTDCGVWRFFFPSPLLKFA